MRATRAATKAVSLSFPSVAIAIVAVTATATAAVAAVMPSMAAAKAPAADCQPFGKAPCLLPFPSNLFTRPDPKSQTGLRLDLPAGAMPINTSGQRVSAAPV